MLRTLDRYIIREIIPPFALSLVVLTFLLQIPPIMREAESLIAKGVSWPIVVQLLVTLIPQALGVTIPMALLIGLLIGLGRLSADREIVAIHACGVSIYRMLRPVVVLAVLAWAATSYVMIVAIPDANQRFREITYNIVAERTESDVKPRVFFEDFPNMVLYVRDIPAAGGWADVFLADTRQADRPEIFTARRGRIALDREARTVDMVLEDGTRHKVAPEEPDSYEALAFDRMVIGLDPESVFPRGGIQRGDRELSIGELQARADEFRRQGLSPHQWIMEIQKKFSIPIACLVFALIGLALGVTSRKDGKLAGFTLGIAVIFAYYVFMYLGEAMAKGRLVPAHLAMWLPNIVLGAAGVAMLVWRSYSIERKIAVPLPWRRRTAPPAGVSVSSATAVPPPGTRVVVVIRFPRFWMPRPNILDRYISRAYLRIMGLAFVGLLGIFYISTFIDLSDKLFKGQTTGWQLLQYFWFATPQFVYYVIPISALVATLVTVGALTKNSELTVMRACGISLYRSAVPLLAFGTLWSLLLFGLAENVLAVANRQADAIRHVIRGGSPQTFDVLNRRWVMGREGEVYHYSYFDPRRNQLNGLSIYELDDADWRISRRMFAMRADFGSSWQARQGWVRTFKKDGEPEDYARFETRALTIEEPEYFKTERPEAERMTYQQLKRYIAELSASGFNVVPLAVDLQRKLSFPLVTVIMTLIAVPFAVTTGSRGALYGVGVGIVLALVYWMTTSAFGAIGSAGMMAPALAAWSPNLLFGAGAIYLLLTVRT